VLGDVASLHRFTPAVASALELALRQALVNVHQHSGVDRAELVVDGAVDAVAVMLADAGAGFDPSAVPTDRLGVSQSIMGRLHDVGGETQLYSSPGNGTAYLFTLPVAEERAWPDGPSAGEAGS
jgi:signal transduction histidine kinase